AIQDRQIGRGERYPALGLHWLLGLVRLAQDDVQDAIAEFDRESELARPYRLYGREYSMHAALARGAALPRGARTADATADFHKALEQYEDHPLAHAGLALASKSGAAWARADAANAAQARTKPIEAVLTRGVLLAARGQADAAATVLNTL